MSFLKRLYYFSTGLIIGIVFLFFILNGKRTSCNYGPSARVIDNIISKKLVLKYKSDSISNDKLYNAITPLLSNLKKNPEKEYILWPNRLKKVEEFEDYIQKIYMK